MMNAAIYRKPAGFRRTTGMARGRGAVLPLVLLISSMMLTTSAVWFETSLVAARNTTNVHDYLQAFQAADSALTLCARSLAAGAVLPLPAVTGEPVGWRRQSTFEAGAFAPVALWPGAHRPPQCLVEGWRLDGRPGAKAFLITARGFGSAPDTQVWLQFQIVIEDGKTERHWRRVAARPL
jgi:Tfp pilus assembly protein PilX